METNENFWLCDCRPELGEIRSVMEQRCPVCEMGWPGWGYPTQSHINEQAKAIQSAQKKVREAKHSLPEARKKPVPSREEFEAAEDYLKKPFDSTCSYAQWQLRLQAAEMTIKRYKALS